MIEGCATLVKAEQALEKGEQIYFAFPGLGEGRVWEVSGFELCPLSFFLPRKRKLRSLFQRIWAHEKSKN